jgi:predicted ferric reductase
VSQPQSENPPKVPRRAARTGGMTPLPPGLPPVLLVILYLVIGSLPLLLAEEQVAGFWRKLSSGMAMVAFALLTMQFVLSSRLAAITGRIGADALMQFHQLAAKVITVALLVHPALYVIPMALADPAAAAGRLVEMFTNGAFASGVLAWVMLLGLTLAAVLRDWLPVRYEAWRLSHGLGAAALAAAGLHHAVNVGSYSDDITLAQLWIVMVAFAFVVIVYLYVVKSWQLGQRPYYVSHVLRLGEGIWGVTLWPAKLQPVGILARGVKPKVTQALAFEAGQYAWVTIGTSPFVLSDHPLFIASAPADRPRFRFVIAETGDFSTALGQIPIGTRAYIDGPYGGFTLSAAEARLPRGKSAAGLAFIALGAGIAPMLSLLRDRKATGETRPMRLLYGNRAVSQIVAREELAAMESEMDFRVRHVLTEPPYEWQGGTGALDGAAVEGWLHWPGAGEWIYFLCGPAAMLEATEQALRARGVPKARILSERLNYD